MYKYDVQLTFSLANLLINKSVMSIDHVETATSNEGLVNKLESNHN